MSKIVIFGAGWIGTKLSESLSATLIDRSTADIGNADQVAKVLRHYRPRVVINAAGKTGRPNIDWCEDNKAETFYANVTAPLVLRNECFKFGKHIYFVHISSGCIYDQGEFEEYDTPNPVSYYGWTKAESERCLLKASEQLPEEMPLILRIRMPIDGMPHPRNLITKLVGYKDIIDVENSITIVDDFIHAVTRLIEKGKIGIYNVVNPQPITHKRIMELYQEIVDSEHRHNLISPDNLRTRAARSNCTLSSDRLIRAGIMPNNTEGAVIKCLEEYSRYKKMRDAK